MAEYPGFGLKITRWGVIFLVAVVILALAAVNTGNNSLMVLFGMALGSYMVSGVWSRQVLGKVSVEAKTPPEIFAGRPVTVRLELTNHSRVFPAYGLVVRDRQGRVVLVEEHLPARGSCARSIDVTFDSRGWSELGPWRLEVLLPLGFFWKSKRVAAGVMVLVYPGLVGRAATAELHRGSEHRLERWSGRGREGEVSQLRDYREGDELRHIHWKQTARQRRLVVAQRQRRQRAAPIIKVDPRLRDPGDPEQLAELETRISRAATAVVRRLARGEAVGLEAGGAVIEPVAGAGHLDLLLRPLAELEAEAYPSALNLARVDPGGSAEASVAPAEERQARGAAASEPQPVRRREIA